jgi:hypothetical protein
MTEQLRERIRDMSGWPFIEETESGRDHQVTRDVPHDQAAPSTMREA